MALNASPNLFLVGASKAGTTSIHHYLNQHPDVFMSPIKEPHFLADEVRPDNFCEEMRLRIEARSAALREFLDGPACEPFSGGPVTSWEDYQKLFKCAGESRVIGESSPCYLWSRSAPANISARFPTAKIAMILRNPVERAFAQYAHMLMFAAAPVSFREHVEQALESKDTRISELYPFLEFGAYSEQVTRYLALFPPENVRVFFYEDLTNAPDLLLRQMFRFLEVSDDFSVNMSKRHMRALVPRSFALNNVLRATGLWDAARLLPEGFRDRVKGRLYRKRDAMKLFPADREWLVDYYREDVIALGTLLKRDLSAWLTLPASS